MTAYQPYIGAEHKEKVMSTVESQKSAAEHAAGQSDHPAQGEPAIQMRKQSTLGEIWAFLRVRKRFWLAPIVIALMLLGALILFAGSAGVVSPFVYMM